MPDPDGITVWEEEEGLRRLVLRAFEGVDADVFLFGSRARGGATARSDWDIGYRCVSEPPRAVLVRLEETLEELPIPVRVELVDFRDVPQEFRRVVLAQGVKVWKKASRNSLFTSTS
ncbi:nucleotidyltransferase family protein [Deferrisoma palaeochoriense]